MINYSRLGYEIKNILAGNKMHLSEIVRSLKENITLKKTIDGLSKNLNAFDDKDSLMHNYLALVKHHVKDDYVVYYSLNNYVNHAII